MAANEECLHARRVVTPDGVIAAAVRVRGDRIVAVEPCDDAPADAESLGRAWLLPGLVDTHVHVNEPGRTEWEGWATASRAALAGGITTIVDMPLNSIPATTNVAALEAKRAAATAALAQVPARVDAYFWGGVVPGNVGELAPLAQAGVRGFKCFLVASGVDEFAHVTGADLAEAMPVITRLGLPLLAHAELPGPIDAAAAAAHAGDSRAHATWLASRPADSEVEAIRLLVRLCSETGCRVHVVHLSAAAALADLHAARARGLPITVETCPHYLAFAAEEIADGATAFKCAPPIRSRSNREALWAALMEGDIDLVASDHSPCPPAMKRRETGDFFAAWGGVASLELCLPVMWTEARARGFSLRDLTRWMALAPARLAGLEGKGRIAPDADADLVVFDPDAEWTVEESELHQRHRLTPYAGRRLTGRVLRTCARGAWAS